MNKPITQHVEFKTTFDLEVEGKTLFDVEFSIAPDGNYRFQVPDCFRNPLSDCSKAPKVIQQFTMTGITTVSNEAFIEALLEKVKRDYP